MTNTWSWRLAVVAVFLAAAGTAVLGMQPDNTQDVRYQLESKLTQLYDICVSDEMCSMRFYLRPQHVVDGNDVSRALDTGDENTEHHKFFRLIVAWAQQDMCPLRANSLRPRTTLSDFDPAEAAWWLTVMNTARICADNQVWEIGRGCVANAERLGQSDAVHTHTRLDSSGQSIVAVTIAISCLTILAAILAAVYYIRTARDDVIKKQTQLINAVRGETTLNGGSKKLVGIDGSAGDDADDAMATDATLEVGARNGIFGL